VQSNGSTVCMIGGSGNRLAKIARTKSMSLANFGDHSV
jgi:hypothetical protein